MIDITDFIVERGGNPDKIRESQKRRGAPVEIVDEIIALFEDHRKTNYEAGTSIGGEINKVQKEIGQIKKNKGDASELLARKEELVRQQSFHRWTTIC